MEPRKRILVVEDEVVIAKDVQISLEKLGYEVCGSAASGEEAIRKVEQEKPDLVLMDIVLKGDMDGIETASRVSFLYDIPVVYLTSYSNEKMLKRAKITEPYGYMLKPFSERELHTTIEIALYKHKMESMLKSREAWFSTTLKSIGDGVITTDQTGRVTFMNRVAEGLTGWKQEEALGESLRNVFHIVDEETGSQVESSVSKIIQDGVSVEMSNHTMLINRDGMQIPIDNSGAPLRNEKGDIIGVVLVFHDITARKLSEQTLRRLERKLRVMFQSVSEGITFTDLDGNIVEINEAALCMHGWKHEEIMGKNAAELIFDKDRTRAVENMRKTLEKGHSGAIEYRLLTKEGDAFEGELSATLIKDERGNPVGFVAITKDITERKRAEEEKREILAELFKAQKMEAVGQLAGGVAHDFNNMLTVIKGHAELSMLSLAKTDCLYGDLEQIDIAADRATNLARQLLLFSRKQPMQPTKVDLNKTVDNLLKMLRRLIGEDVVVRTKLEKMLWPVLADEGNVEQVIMNLVINARDAILNGGKITIQSENVILDRNDLKTKPGIKPGQFVCLSVLDTGIGMDGETLQHIFEPFFTKKEHGTGLGLSVVYGIVKQHSGFIDVQSQPDQGSTFRVYLPVMSASKPEDRSEKKVSSLKLDGKGERILLVEDEDIVRNFMTNVLGRSGYIVFGTATFREAMDVFERENGKFRLILSDVVLPDGNGVQLVEQLQSRKPDMGVLLCSGYFDEKLEMIKIFDNDLLFLQKPFTIPGLLQAVKEAVTKNDKKSESVLV